MRQGRNIRKRVFGFLFSFASGGLSWRSVASFTLATQITPASFFTDEQVVIFTAEQIAGGEDGLATPLVLSTHSQHMSDVFCTSSDLFQVVETSDGVWKRPIPGRVEKISGTPLKGYYERVVTFRTLARTWTTTQTIVRPELVQQWKEGDPNLMDMDFYLWREELETDAPFDNVAVNPPKKWRMMPVTNLFGVFVKYLHATLTIPDTYRVTLHGVKWDVKLATHYSKEHDDGATITQMRNMVRDGNRWRKLSCNAWKEVVQREGSGTDWSWCVLQREPVECQDVSDKPIRRRYRVVFGAATLVFDDATHLEWDGEFPYADMMQFSRYIK